MSFLKQSSGGALKKALLKIYVVVRESLPALSTTTCDAGLETLMKPKFPSKHQVLKDSKDLSLSFS